MANFKFISEDFTGYTAADATTLDSFDLGALFKNSDNEFRFRLGNIGSSTFDFQLGVSGVNTDITDGVTFSEDGDTFTSTIVVSGLIPNGVSDLLHCKLALDSDNYTTSGTFILRVDEV